MYCSQGILNQQQAVEKKFMNSHCATQNKVSTLFKLKLECTLPHDDDLVILLAVNPSWPFTSNKCKHVANYSELLFRQLQIIENIPNKCLLDIARNIHTFFSYN